VSLEGCNEAMADHDLELLGLIMMGGEDKWPADIESTLEQLLCNADQLPPMHPSTIANDPLTIESL